MQNPFLRARRAIPVLFLVHAVAAHAQHYCIDTSFSGAIARSVSLALHAVDGRSVLRHDVTLAGIDAARRVLLVRDKERIVELDLREWNEVRVIVDHQSSPIAQMAVPEVISLPSIEHATFPIQTLRVSQGLIEFPGCSTETRRPGKEVRFDGTLKFSTQAGSVEINGTVVQLSSPPSSGRSANPGAAKQ